MVIGFDSAQKPTTRNDEFVTKSIRVTTLSSFRRCKMLIVKPQKSLQQRTTETRTEQFKQRVSQYGIFFYRPLHSMKLLCSLPTAS